ncbi:DPP IV N-terminal domain-containing protein [candidate division KSB1 bacterium]
MLRRIFILVSACTFLFTAMTAGADPIKFARYPHIHNGRIAFSYHGDVWIADDDGSNPRRLTAHVANDVFPRFSPDGRWIAFTSNRMGNNDIWVIPVAGGEPRQLTFHTTGDNILYWTPDSQHILFASSRAAHPFASPLYSVSVQGGVPVALEIDRGSLGMISQDGSKLAFNRKSFSYWRKGYMGNRTTDIYVQDLGSKEITQLTDQDLQQFRGFRHDAYPMWGADGMVYFLSERSDIFNIWKIAADGGEPVQVTFHDRDGVQFPSISPDGREIIYENEFDLWKLTVPGGSPQRITVDLAFDPKENLVEYLRAENNADGFSPNKEGDYLAVDYHGEIFIVPTDPEIGEIKQVTSSIWRDRYQQFSPDGKYLAYISDESGEEELWLYSNDTGERTKLTTHESNKSSFVWSDDSKKIAFSAVNDLVVADVESGRMERIDHHEAGGYTIHEFSPDGGWLVMTMRDDDMNRDVYLYNIDERRANNVTRNPFSDSGGEITPDGKYLIFTSNRDGGTTHLFKLSLVQLTEDPDDPLVKERLKKEARPESGEEAAPPAVSLDMDGIERRAIQITSGSNGAGNFFLSADGETIYFTSSDDDGPGLFSVDLYGKNRRKLTDGDFRSLVYTGDRKTVFYRQQDAVYKMPLSDRDKERIAFDFSVVVDKRAEWEQIFEESWRVMKYRFYDQDMHGTEWDAVKREYKPLLKYAGDYQDVYDICNEMIGELNASHTGVRGPTREMPETYQTRFPGFEIEPGTDYYRISHIYRDGPADKEWIDLNVGDYVFAIDGQEFRSGENYWKLLNQTLNEYITVKAGSDPDPHGAGIRDIRIRTVTSLSNIKYEEWVNNNRDYVDRISDNQIAYVHIRSMNQSSLQKFENEISQFSNKKGIVVDIRYNGGGNIDQQLLDILERRPYEFWNTRWGSRQWGRRPRQAIAGPKVMLINHRSGSDSEVTPMGFRDLGLGRIVGNPTAAAVIATGSYRLINGGTIRTPGSLVVTWDPSKPNNYGINLENYGVAPDVFVRNSPEDELKGLDRELETAVQEAMKMLNEQTWQYDRE